MTRKRSITRPRPKNVADEFMQAIEEAADFAQGRGPARIHRRQVETPPIVAIRKRLGMSQNEFAQALGVSASGLKKWEQGQRQPTGAARILLRIMQTDPEIVRRASRAA